MWLRLSWKKRLTFIFFIFPEPSLAFSHSPGCMFLCDVQDPAVNPTSVSTDQTAGCESIPSSFLISHDPLLYSLASQKVVKKIRKLERIIGEDPGEPSDFFSHNSSIRPVVSINIRKAQTALFSRTYFFKSQNVFSQTGISVFSGSAHN